MSASLDGCLAREEGVLDWMAYEEMGPAWSGSDNPMARLMNSTPKLVFSRTAPKFEWANARHSARPVGEEIAELKRGGSGDGDIVCLGGARFAHSLARQRLIDEYRLTIHPVALGEGLPLWHGLPEPQRFAPVSVAAYPDGVVTHVLTAPRS